MLRWLSRALVVIALCISIGGHLMALQTFAWATMVVSYSQHGSLSAALAKTFDGEHPCDLCKHVNAAQHSQKKSDAQPIAAKPDLICVSRATSFLPPFTDFAYPAWVTVASHRSQVPPVPPPRFALV